MYLHALKSVTAPLVESSCDRLLMTWTAEEHYTSPTPADIFVTARKIRGEAIVGKRDEEMRAQLDHARQTALPRGEVQKLLSELTKKLRVVNV